MLRTLLMKFSIMMSYLSLLGFALPPGNKCYRPARRFDLFARRLAEAVRSDVERLSHIAVAKNHHAVVPRELALLNNPALDHQVRSDLIGRLEATVEIGEVHFDPFFLEYVGEAAFGQSPLKRHLAAFKTGAA